MNRSATISHSLESNGTDYNGLAGVASVVVTVIDDDTHGRTDTDGDDTDDDDDPDDDNDGVLDDDDPAPLNPGCIPGATTQNGSPTNPYCIDSLAELQSIDTSFANEYTRSINIVVTNSLSRHYRLIANIDAWPVNNASSGSTPPRPSTITYADGSTGSPGAYDSDTYPNGFNPIGGDTVSERFTGTFNGGGHTIHGLRIIANASGNWALFSIIGGGGAEVADLHLRMVDIDGSNTSHDRVGALVGELLSGATVDGVSMSGKVDGGDGEGDVVGGLVGDNYSLVQNSYATGTVNGEGAPVTMSVAWWGIV